MESGNSQPEKVPRFYHGPTNEDIEKYGPIVADERARILAERTSSRIYSALFAVATGASISVIETLKDGDERLTATSFIVPIVINGVAQIRTEHVQRRELHRLDGIAGDIREDAQHIQSQLELAEQENQELRSIIYEAGLDLPDEPPD